MRAERRDLFTLSLLIGLGIPAQGVIGGLSVLTGLNPYVVGLHFVVSIVLVVPRHGTGAPGVRDARPRALAVPRWYAVIAHITSAVVADHDPGRHPDHGVRPARRRRGCPAQRPRPRASCSTCTPGPPTRRWRSPSTMLVAVLVAKIPGGGPVLLLLAVEVVQIVVGLDPGAHRPAAACSSACTWCSPRASPRP